MKKLFVITCFLIGGLTATQAQQTSPVWPGCEDSADKSECFNQKLGEHVKNNYEFPMKENQYIRGKVTVSFDVNDKGEVIVKSVEGPEPEVNKAAREMLEKIPDMEPGTLNGEPDTRNFTTTYQF